MTSQCNACDRSPDLGVPPDWSPIEPPAVWDGCSFVFGDPSGDRLRMSHLSRRADGALVAKVLFGPGASGPPGHAHGGSIAAVLDEIMGMGAWLAGHRVMAATLKIRFVRSVPLDFEAVAEARLTSVRGRKVQMRGRLIHPDNETVFAEAEGLFVKLGREQLETFVEHFPTLKELK